MAIAVIIALSITLVLVVRLAKNERTARRVAVALAVVLLLNKAVVYWTVIFLEKLDFPNALPMHLCDWSAIAVITALLWRKQVPYELAYFWGWAVMLQATLTPDLRFDFPDVRFITFFVSHGGDACRGSFSYHRPWDEAVSEIARADFHLEQHLSRRCRCGRFFVRYKNYGYLRHKPLNPSLLDYLGPWPLYILSLEGIALVFRASFITRRFSSWIWLARGTENPASSG